jgi:Trk K+ transport system NAD-binding subunit
VLGARILLDLQECTLEFLATEFGLPSRHSAVRALEWLEQLSIRFADHVITPTQPMRRTFVARGAKPGKITVVMDGSDDKVFAIPPDLPERFPEQELRALRTGRRRAADAPEAEWRRSSARELRRPNALPARYCRRQGRVCRADETMWLRLQRRT